MLRIALVTTLIACSALILLAAPAPAVAQRAIVAPGYAAPVLTYLPERRGVFGQRLVYRPVVGLAPVAPPVVVRRPVTTYYAPAPVRAYYAPAPAVRAYYRPLAPPRRVISLYAPAPVVYYP